MPDLSTQIILRPIRVTDANAIAQHANNPSIAGNLTNAFPYPYTKEDAERFIAFASDTDARLILAVAINDELIGAIGVHPQQDIFCKNAELGYWLAQAYWGQGIITKAIEMMVPIAFATFPITRLFARPFGSNIASQKALEKNNFVLEASYKKTFFKNNKFEDELVYAVRKGE